MGTTILTNVATIGGYVVGETPTEGAALQTGTRSIIHTTEGAIRVGTSG